MKNYHGQEEKIKLGNKIMHVDDNGALFPALVTEISTSGDEILLGLEFEDGDFGLEMKNTCYLTA
jgi:hypothetical protein